VWTLPVVLAQPRIRDFAHLVDRFEHAGIEHLISTGLVEAFDEGVPVGLARMDEAQLDTASVRSYTPQLEMIGYRVQNPQLLVAEDPDHQRHATVEFKIKRYECGLAAGLLRDSH
jgi:hypothetical protein